MMKILAIETIRLPEFPNQLYVQVHAEGGGVGLGETRNGAAAVEAWIHDCAAPALLGEDALAIERHWQALNPMLGFASSGAECRGRSALDIAFWDLLGQATGQPIWQLLGGAVRDRIPLYNTCVGPGYTRKIPRVARLLSDNWNVEEGATPGAFEDLAGWRERPAELARDLLSHGIRAMKIWPFDTIAEKSTGHRLPRAELARALQTFALIREAVGDQMDILVEMHGLWDLPGAQAIIEALRPYQPYWIEDPVKADDIGSLAELTRGSGLPIAAGETLGTRWGFRELIEKRAVGTILCDAGYAGGISEARRIAAFAEAYQRPFALHDCTGPVNFMVNTHLSAHLPNVGLQEFARAFYHGWYAEIVSVLPRVDGGEVEVPRAPGLGTALRPELLERGDLVRRCTNWR